jgi:hypothetical protein
LGSARPSKAPSLTSPLANPSLLKNSWAELQKKVTFVSHEQGETMQKRIGKWLSTGNLQKAKGKTREEIFKEFGNRLEPIVYINPEYLQYLGENLKDNKVYSGKGYFIDHAVNHHPEITPEEYGRIQDILNHPDEVKLDSRSKGKTSLIFIKKYDNYFAEVISVDRDSNNKIIFHKTYYYKEKTPQKTLPNVELENLSLVDGLPTISPAKAAAVPRNISALNDNAKIENNSENTKENEKIGMAEILALAHVADYS